MISNIQLDDGLPASATSLDVLMPEREMKAEVITATEDREPRLDDFLVYPRPFRFYGGSPGIWDSEVQHEWPIRQRKALGKGSAILLTLSLGSISSAASTHSPIWTTGDLPTGSYCCRVNTAASEFDQKSPRASQVERVNRLLATEQFDAASVHAMLRLLSVFNDTGHSVRTIEKTQDHSIIIQAFKGSMSTFLDFYPDGDIVLIQESGKQEHVYEFSVDKTPEIVALVMNGSM